MEELTHQNGDSMDLIHKKIGISPWNMRIWPAEMENLSSQEGDLIKKWTYKRNKEWRI